MPRQVRIQFPGAYYHVMCRGDRREPIFEDDDDRLTFLRSSGSHGLEDPCLCPFQGPEWNGAKFAGDTVGGVRGRVRRQFRTRAVAPPAILPVCLDKFGSSSPGALCHVMCREDHGLEEAEKIVAGGLAEFGLEPENLGGLPKGAVGKAVIARDVQARTSAPQAWIIKNLVMGTTSNIKRAIRASENGLRGSPHLRRKEERKGSA